MFNIGGSEMVVLAILALLVFGPEGLPGIVKNVMRTVRALRAAANDFQTEVKTALEIENERIDKAKRRRRTAPLNSSSLSGELPNDINGASPQISEKVEELAVDESPEDAQEHAKPEPPEEVAKEEPETVSGESSPDIPEDDDDGPGLPMLRKKVEETA